MNDETRAVLQASLERAVTGDGEARRRLLELTRDRLVRHARRFLHGRYARLEPFAQTDDVVQQLYLKILHNQDRFWVNADGEPVRTLAEFFGHTSAWMRDVLCDLLRKVYGRGDDRPAPLLLDDLEVELLDDVVGLLHRLHAGVTAVQQAPGVAHQAVAGEFQQPLPGRGVARQGPLQLPLQDGGRLVAHWPRPLLCGRRALSFRLSEPGTVVRKSPYRQ